MTLPKTIRVGALDYTVKVDEDLTDLGGCNVDTLAIYLRAGLPVQKTCEVLIHEVLHACYDGASLAKAGKLTEEQVVNGLGYQLVQVMRDNPALLEFVGEVFGHGPKPLSDALEVVTGGIRVVDGLRAQARRLLRRPAAAVAEFDEL